MFVERVNFMLLPEMGQMSDYNTGPKTKLWVDLLHSPIKKTLHYNSTTFGQSSALVHINYVTKYIWMRRAWSICRKWNPFQIVSVNLRGRELLICSLLHVNCSLGQWLQVNLSGESKMPKSEAESLPKFG